MEKVIFSWAPQDYQASIHKSEPLRNVRGVLILCNVKFALIGKFGINRGGVMFLDSSVALKYNCI